MKIRFPFAIPALIAAAALSGCAQINAGLDELNGALSKANSALSGSGLSGASGQSYTIPDKVTAQYEIRNLKLRPEKITGDVSHVRFEGQALSKSKKLLNISITVPGYDQQNNFVNYAIGEVHLPPGEKTRVDAVSPLALQDGHHMNIQKIKFSVAEY